MNVMARVVDRYKSPSDWPGRVIVETACAVGCLMCFTATVLWLCSSTGTVPAWLYSMSWVLTRFKPASSGTGVPCEYYGLLAFTALFALRRPNSVANSTTIRIGASIAVLLLGVFGMRAWNLRLVNWSDDFAALAALLVLSVSNFDARPSHAGSRVHGGPVIGRDIRPLRRLLLLCFLTGSLLGGIGLSAAARQLSAEESARRNLVRWLATQHPTSLRDDPNYPAVRVVIFTDHRSTTARAGFAVAETVVRGHATAGVPVELVVRDFVMGASCNTVGLDSADETSCVAAAAARLVRARTDQATAIAFEQWCYQVGPKLTLESIDLRLKMMGLADEFALKRNELLGAITDDVSQAHNLGVTRVPTFSVNGVLLPYARDLGFAVAFEVERQQRRLEREF